MSALFFERSTSGEVQVDGEGGEHGLPVEYGC